MQLIFLAAFCVCVIDMNVYTDNVVESMYRMTYVECTRIAHWLCADQQDIAHIPDKNWNHQWCFALVHFSIQAIVQRHCMCA